MRNCNGWSKLNLSYKKKIYFEFLKKKKKWKEGLSLDPYCYYYNYNF